MADVNDYATMISTIQELMALPSTGHLTNTVVPRYMSTLCKSLGLSYCKLTALSTSGECAAFHYLT